VESHEVRVIAMATPFLLLGLGLGIVQFAWLRENVRLYVEGPRKHAVLLHAARLGSATGVIAAFVGLLFARVVVTARTLREA
jgi:hypothetical protein